MCIKRKKKGNSIKFSLADIAYVIQQPSRGHYNSCIFIAQLQTVNLQLLNQINKTRHIEIYIYPSSFVISN